MYIQPSCLLHSTDSILIDANTRGGRAEAHRGGIRTELRLAEASYTRCDMSLMICFCVYM